MNILVHQVTGRKQMNGINPYRDRTVPFWLNYLLSLTLLWKKGVLWLHRCWYCRECCSSRSREDDCRISLHVDHIWEVLDELFMQC
mmetsp:Transcript_41843/g.63242  ORF Transcript_41843/g.63242 Transcript_41843/m.63242 type:complete len:86 (-) Transcript_41843:490-747(-)